MSTPFYVLAADNPFMSVSLCRRCDANGKINSVVC